MISVGLAIGLVLCAVLAIRAARLLIAALWLACASALLSVLLYQIGGREIAVIELSVGAGLVTVLFVFALNLIGEESSEERLVIPKPLAWVLVLIAVILLGTMVPALSRPEIAPAASEPSFSVMLWQQRSLDVVVQVALIFAGVLGVLGLLSGAGLSPGSAEFEQPEAVHEDHDIRGIPGKSLEEDTEKAIVKEKELA